MADDETLARFVLFSGHIRASSKTLRPDAFMPPPDLGLSVTRHLSTSEAEIWRIGESVAAERERSLLGRGDVGTTVCKVQNLIVRAAPISGNPNHAHVVGWPADKPTQKAIAQEIAAASRFVEKTR